MSGLTVNIHGGNNNLRLPQQPSSSSSSVQSTPNPSPRSQVAVNTRCDVCHYAVLPHKLLEIDNCPHKFCVECFNKSHSSGSVVCPLCATSMSCSPRPLPKPSQRELRVQAKYDDRRHQPLGPALQRIQDDRDFVQTTVTGLFSHSMLTDTVTVRRNWTTPRFDMFEVFSSIDNMVISGKGRTLSEACWQFNRELRCTHHCHVCSSYYRGNKSCPTCELREVLNPAKECGVCKEETGLIYELKCGHIYCKPCLIKQQKVNPQQALRCPECRALIRLNRGWVEQKVCECGHDYDNEEYDSDDEGVAEEYTEE